VKKEDETRRNENENELKRLRFRVILRVIFWLLSMFFLHLARFFNRNREGNGVVLTWISAILSLIFGVLAIILEKFF
jgi:hypothetical protein